MYGNNAMFFGTVGSEEVIELMNLQPSQRKMYQLTQKCEFLGQVFPLLLLFGSYLSFSISPCHSHPIQKTFYLMVTFVIRKENLNLTLFFLLLQTNILAWIL